MSFERQKRLFLIKNTNAFKYSLKDIFIVVASTYPISKNSQNKFSRQKSVQNPLNNPQVGSQWDVALEAHIRKFRLRGNMNSHVLPLKKKR